MAHREQARQIMFLGWTGQVTGFIVRRKTLTMIKPALTACYKWWIWNLEPNPVFSLNSHLSWGLQWKEWKLHITWRVQVSALLWCLIKCSALFTSTRGSTNCQTEHFHWQQTWIIVILWSKKATLYLNSHNLELQISSLFATTWIWANSHVVVFHDIQMQRGLAGPLLWCV